MLCNYFLEFTDANCTFHRIWVGHTGLHAAVAVESLGIEVQSIVEFPDGTVRQKIECGLPANEWLFNYRCANPRKEDDYDCDELLE